MDKILNILWWSVVTALLPLYAGFIIHYIYEENFCFAFWFTAVIYFLLSTYVGSYLYLLGKRKDN